MKDPAAEIAVALIKFSTRRRLTTADVVIGCLTAASATMHQMTEAEHLKAMEGAIGKLRADYLARVPAAGDGKRN